MYLIHYATRHSLTGVGLTIATNDAMRDEYLARLDVISCMHIDREDVPVFTPSVVEACIGDSPSM